VLLQKLVFYLKKTTPALLKVLGCFHYYYFLIFRKVRRLWGTGVFLFFLQNWKFPAKEETTPPCRHPSKGGEWIPQKKKTTPALFRVLGCFHYYLPFVGRWYLLLSNTSWFTAKNFFCLALF